MRRPRILVTLDLGVSTRKDASFPNVNLKAAYVRAVEQAGGTPILAAPTEDADVLEALAALMDGLLISGGAFDIDPARYGAAQSGRLDRPLPLRTDFEWSLCDRALTRGVPILGICGGMQLLNVVRGGTLIQDIRTAQPTALDHEQATSPALPAHPVSVTPGTPFSALVGEGPLAVNTTHHQAVDRLGEGLEAWGHAPDGVVEVIGMGDRPSVLGVQWHPELLEDRVSRALYGHLVDSAIRVIRAP